MSIWGFTDQAFGAFGGGGKFPTTMHRGDTLEYYFRLPLSGRIFVISGRTDPDTGAFVPLFGGTVGTGGEVPWVDHYFERLAFSLIRFGRSDPYTIQSLFDSLDRRQLLQWETTRRIPDEVRQMVLPFWQLLYPGLDQPDGGYVMNESGIVVARQPQQPPQQQPQQQQPQQPPQAQPSPQPTPTTQPTPGQPPQYGAPGGQPWYTQWNPMGFPGAPPTPYTYGQGYMIPGFGKVPYAQVGFPPSPSAMGIGSQAPLTWGGAPAQWILSPGGWVYNPYYWWQQIPPWMSPDKTPAGRVRPPSPPSQPVQPNQPTTPGTPPGGQPPDGREPLPRL